MKQSKPRIKIEEVTIETVKPSIFGCRNCLWASCECSKGSKFNPTIVDNLPSCTAYTYFD